MSEKRNSGLYTDEEMLYRAVLFAQRRKAHTPKWASVSDVFGCGSVVAADLCERFGFDPETGNPTPSPVSS